LTTKSSTPRRAISPILATLLLVVIAVAAIVVTYAWVMTFMAHTTGQAGVLLYESNVRFYSNGTQIDVAVGNSGTSDTTIIALYVGTSSSSMENQTIASEPLAAGSVQTITVNYPWTPGATYYFKVVVNTGQTLGPWPEQAPTS
jgi:flagellin-like protein